MHFFGPRTKRTSFFLGYTLPSSVVVTSDAFLLLWLMHWKCCNSEWVFKYLLKIILRSRLQSSLQSSLWSWHRSFIVLATVITIVNYDRKTFIVQSINLRFSRQNPDPSLRIWGQSYKSFYLHNLQMFVISFRVFVPGRPFLMFSSKAPFRCSTLG